MHAQCEPNAPNFVDSLMTIPLELAKGVELIEGANHQPMLVHIPRGKYVRLSKLGVDVVQMLDGQVTGNDVVEKLETIQQGLGDASVVHQFFFDLQKAGMLNVEPEKPRGIRAFGGNLGERSILKLPLVRSMDRLNNGMSQMVRHIPVKTLPYLIPIALVLAFICLFIDGYIHGFFWNPTQVIWPLVFMILICHLAVHELSHAAVALYYKVKIREIGVGLLYWFIPVAYVDRTDGYRLKEKKSRMNIALAGPVSDGLAVGVWSAVALVVGRNEWGETIHLVATFIFFLMLGNLNLLLPTDGYHAVEAVSGELSLRKRAMTYLRCTVFRRPLPLYLQHLSRKRSFFFLGYAIVSIAYILFLFLATFVYFMVLFRFFQS